MKKAIFTAVCLLHLSFFLQGQTITKYEYWFDSDDTRKQTVTTSGSTLNVNVELDVTALSEGIHSLNFRAQDNKGAWSAPLSHFFYRVSTDISERKIVRYEYWFDSDDTRKQTATTSGNTVDVNVELNVTALSEGIHSLNFRAQDDRGAWSAPLSHFFYRVSTDISERKIVRYEYWFDTNDAQKKTVITSDNVIIVSLATDVSALSEGMHYFNFRAQDDKGAWSAPLSQLFYRSEITQEADKSIVAGAGEGGAISPGGLVTVSHGGSQTFTFTPDTNYEIDMVLVDDVNNADAVNSGNYTFSDVTSDHTISVTFKQKKSNDVTLTALSVTGYSISPVFSSGVTDYMLTVPNSISTIVVNASATHPNAVVGGTGSKTLTVGQNVCTVTVTAENGVTQKTYTVTVTRLEADKTVTATAGTGGTIAPSGAVKIGHGGSQQFTVTPNTGYVIDKILVNGVNNTDAVNSGSYTFTNVTADHTISASFTKLGTDATLSSLSVTGYSVSPAFNPNTVSYTLSVPNAANNIVINAVATHPNAVVIGSGTKTLAVGQNVCTVTVTAEDGVTKKTYTVTITRSETDKTITATAGTGGTIVPSGAVKVGHGGSQKFTVTPNAGYVIDRILIDGVNNTEAVNSGSYTFTNVTADHTISVSFKEKKSDDATLSSLSVTGYSISPAFSSGIENYTLTVPSGTGSVVISAVAAHANATVAGAGTKTLTVGQNVCTVTVTAEDGVAKKTYTLTVTRPEADKTITASAGAGGTVTPSGAVTVAHGGSQAFTFKPNTGYEVDKVLIDGVNDAYAVDAGSYTFTNVVANHTVEVLFRSSRTDLGNIETPSGGNLLPAFSRNVTSYRLLLGCGQNEISVRFTTVYASASVVADGVRLTGDGTAVFSLDQPGQRTVNVSVEDGTDTRDYLITLIRPFDNAVTPVWDDVLSVINNPANNGGYTFTQYQWYSDKLMQNAVPGGTGANIQVPDNNRTNYTVWLVADNGTASYGCVRESLKQTLAVKAYPNPASDKVIVEMETGDGEILIELRNMQGTLLQKKKVTPPIFEVNMSGLPPGIYLLTAGDTTVRIVKE